MFNSYRVNNEQDLRLKYENNTRYLNNIIDTFAYIPIISWVVTDFGVTVRFNDEENAGELQEDLFYKMVGYVDSEFRNAGLGKPYEMDTDDLGQLDVYTNSDWVRKMFTELMSYINTVNFIRNLNEVLVREIVRRYIITEQSQMQVERQQATQEDPFGLTGSMFESFLNEELPNPSDSFVEFDPFRFESDVLDPDIVGNSEMSSPSQQTPLTNEDEFNVFDDDIPKLTPQDKWDDDWNWSD